MPVASLNLGDRGPMQVSSASRPEPVRDLPFRAHRVAAQATLRFCRRLCRSLRSHYGLRHFDIVEHFAGRVGRLRYVQERLDAGGVDP